MPRSDYIFPLKFRIEDSFNTICEEIKYHNADVLIHLAGIVNIEECENDPKKCYKINVEGSEKIFKAASNSGIKRFVYVSTSHVYKTTDELIPIDIKTKTHPSTVYAKSKLLAENRIIFLSKKFLNTKISIARVFSVLSNLMKKGFLLTTIHEMAKSKKFEPIKGLNNVRDFLWATDVCNKLIHLCQSKSFPSKLHICSGKPKKILKLVEEVFEQYEIDKSNIINNNLDNQKNFLVGKPSEFI